MVVSIREDLGGKAEGGERFEMSFVSWGAICFLSHQVEVVGGVWKSSLQVRLV